MDGKRFDELSRSLASRHSRQGVLKTIGGGIAAGLAALGLGEASAAPGGKGKGGGTRCGGPGQPCKWNSQCCEYSGLVCLNGTCGCEDNFCPSSGACLPECPAGKAFNAGSCTCECPDNMTDCGGTCRANADICGDCQTCPDGYGCETVGRDDRSVCCPEGGGTCTAPIPF